MIREEVKMRVSFSYLDRQFADPAPYLEDIEALVHSGEFTLGKAVGEFEERLAEIVGVPFAIGVSSGTDAIALSLKALGIGEEDEVITTPLTFVATVGAIIQIGARPVFVDSRRDLLIDSDKIEAAITKRTKAIVPVDYSGNVADMPLIFNIAQKHHLKIVEDACQAIYATMDGRPVGSWSEAACISLHPLKNINVWGDGGVILTKDRSLSDRLKLMRNHGLFTRDEVTLFGWNARLHSLQATIGKRLIEGIEEITNRRIELAKRYDGAFSDLGNFIQIPMRRKNVKHVYHLYIIHANRRDRLLNFLHNQGVDAKIHYPIPVHLQKAAKSLGYHEGDFPVSESCCKDIISLPLHQHLTDEELNYTIKQVRAFYLKGGTV